MREAVGSATGTNEAGLSNTELPRGMNEAGFRDANFAKGMKEAGFSSTKVQTSGTQRVQKGRKIHALPALRSPQE